MIGNKQMVFSKAGNTSPDAHQYIQLPKIATTSLPTAAAAIAGAIVYNTTTMKLQVCSNSSGSYAWEGVESAA